MSKFRFNEYQHMISLYAIMLSHRRTEQEYHELFKQEFNVNLHDYFDYMTGFDIVKFDTEFLKTPDGISTRDYVTKKYGSYASDLIESIFAGKVE